MKKVFLYSLFAMGSMQLWQACQKDLSGEGSPNIINNTPVSASVTGQILDDQNKPLQGALITAGTATATTNVNGEFTINNTSLNRNAGVIKVAKAGFFDGYRTIVVNEGKQHFVRVKMMKKNIRGQIDGNAGGSLTMPSGMRLTLPAGAVVVKSTGAAYTGQVSVAEAFIDPTATDGNLIMPGDLRGNDATGAERILQSFGMVAIELQDARGQALQIATSKTADLSFPIPSTLQGNAPATIALWSFDETTGMWKEEATATKVGNAYEGSVKHFSFWNCDIGQPLVEFSATFKDQNGNPIRYATVKLVATSRDNSTGYGYTDSAGYVHGKIFANATFTLALISQCQTAIYTQTFSSTTTAVNLGTIVVTVTNVSATISGTAITCAGAPVTNGYAQIYVADHYYNANISNGAFSINISLCSTPATATVLAVDVAGTQQGTSTTLTLNAGANAAGQLSACGTSTQQFINWTVNGTTYALTTPPDSIAGYFASQGTTFNQTSVSGYSINNLPARAIQFTFDGFANTTSVHQLQFIGGTNLDSSNGFPSTNILVNITEYGAVGQFIAGNFAGVVNSAFYSPRNVTCSFRVRRQR
jgi:hypothetical protein